MLYICYARDTATLIIKMFNSFHLSHFTNIVNIINPGHLPILFQFQSTLEFAASIDIDISQFTTYIEENVGPKQACSIFNKNHAKKKKILRHAK